MTKPQLLELAESMGIVGVSNANLKAEIISAILEG